MFQLQSSFSFLSPNASDIDTCEFKLRKSHDCCLQSNTPTNPHLKHLICDDRCVPAIRIDLPPFKQGKHRICFHHGSGEFLILFRPFIILNEISEANLGHDGRRTGVRLSHHRRGKSEGNLEIIQEVKLASHVILQIHLQSRLLRRVVSLVAWRKSVLNEFCVSRDSQEFIHFAATI